MALVRRFEDLEAWREARKLAGEVYAIIESGPMRRDFALSDQVRRAAISTMNNIAEGFDSASSNEFRRFLRYAARSASEVQSCLYLALDRQYVAPATFDHLYGRAESVRRLCLGLSKRLSTYGAASRSRGGGDVREPAAGYDRLEAKLPTGAPAHRRTGAPAPTDVPQAFVSGEA